MAGMKPDFLHILIGLGLVIWGWSGDSVPHMILLAVGGFMGGYGIGGIIEEMKS